MTHNPAALPTRLQPRAEVIRQLYLKSGNRCAFPQCPESIVRDDGTLAAQVCHIEAAMRGGQRYNPTQTDEERRGYANLIILCYAHHKTTDNVALYPVQSLQKMKADHERKFSDVVRHLQASIVDHTTLSSPLGGNSLDRLYSVLNWPADTAHERAENLRVLAEMIGRLSKVPEQARQLLAVMIRRSDAGAAWRHKADLEVSVADIELATQLAESDLRKLIAILDCAGFIDCDNHDDYGLPLVVIRQLPVGWTFWRDLKAFCAKSGASLEAIVGGCDFTPLD